MDRGIAESETAAFLCVAETIVSLRNVEICCCCCCGAGPGAWGLMVVVDSLLGVKT